jgi:aspartokinase
LKAGGSVLRNRESYLQLAVRCLPLLEQYDKLHVIVSAKKGETSRLLDEFCMGNQNEIDFYNGAMKGQVDLLQIDRECQRRLADYLLQGEIESAYELKNSFETLGIESRVFEQGRNFPIIANNNHLMGHLEIEKSVDKYRQQQLSQVNVYAGFGAENDNGEKVLLGRNRSDLVAAIIAHLVKSRDVGVRLVYLKDQDGIIRNFGSDNAELIPRISVQELRKGSYDQVLCRDVYDWVDGFDIGISNAEKFNVSEPGTIIYRGEENV